MIVESILEGVLSKYLDKWFYGISKDNMKAEVLKGRFVISNIGLKQSIFMGTNMPYDLRHSYVEKIQLNTNWTSNERVLSINISKIYALLSIKEDLDLDTIFMQLKKSSIKDHINELIKNETTKIEAEKQGKQKKDGGISGFLKKLLDNVNINIKSIHLRFEDKGRKYSFGLRVQQIQIINVDERENPEYFNRQKSNQDYINYRLTIDPLQIYLNPNQSTFLHGKSVAEITNEMIKMDNYRRFEGANYTMFDGINQMNNSYFINILAISVKGILKRYINREDSKHPEYECNVTFNYIQSNISNLQFHAILSIIHEMSWYQGMVQFYRSKVELVSRKERQGAEIINLIHKPKSNKKQKEVVKKMTIKHLSWAFKQSLLDVWKKKFMREALKKQITVENLFANEQIKTIIRRVQIHRVKQWIEICQQMRKRYQKEISIFVQKSKQFQKFYKKQLQKLKQLKQQRQQNNLAIQFKQQQNQVILKLSVMINKLEIRISENNRFGVRAQMEKTKIDILKRRQNFKLVMSVSDLITDVFKMGYGQKYPTYVPILKKSMQEGANINSQYLLYLQFQKSPIGKPFVFSSSKIDFQSIQITFYPEVLSNLYQIFIKESSSQGNAGQQQLKKKKTNVKSSEPSSSLSGSSFQYNIIQGFIKSPWIIIPLSHTNDSSKDCWVLRLGDLNIQTPVYQLSMKSDSKLFYERYYVQLKAFQLKYFTSVDFFHIWMENADSLEALRKIPGFKNNKYIDIISPISCSVDLSMMKKHVSPIVKKTRQSFIAQIKIQKVSIRLPKLLLDKLKQRVDVFGDDKKTQDFIETNPKNIVEQNTIQGLMTISNQKFKGITFYAILKGYFLYFFFEDSRDEVIFTVDVRDTSIRLTSDHHTYINEGKNKKLNIQLKQKQQHALWKKNLTQLVSKRDRINDKSLANTNSFRHQDGFSKIENKPSNIIQQLSQSSQLSFKQQDLEKIIQKQQTLLSLFFVMESLELQLIDENQKQFLLCIFKKTKLSYLNLKQKELIFSILQWQILQNNNSNQAPATQKKEDKKTHKKNIPFLSCKRLFKESDKRGQFQTKKDIKQEEESNFLQVKVLHNHITGQLNEIRIKVDQLYISWNIPIFNKILKFFFYKSEMADAPTAPSTQKKSLTVKFNMQKFYLYCFHDQQLIALVKLHIITIDYSQSNIQEKYKVNCEKFQMDKYVENDQNKRVPMIICPKKLESMRKKMKSMRSFQFSDNDSVKMEESAYQPHNKNLIMDIEGNQGTNPMFLQYTIRKLKTQEFPNITKLKKKFGQDLLVSQLQCNWQNFVIYFDMEQTIRLINYFINQILGTVASKFKKKQYSLNYIFETLKFKKITTFKINFKDFIAMLTPHSRVDHFFQIKVRNVDFTKNIRNDKPQYEPKQVLVPTKRSTVSVFYDTMVFDIEGVTPFYRFRNYAPERLTKSPFNVTVTYSKLSFSRQYEPILNSLSQIDRTIKVKVKINPGFILQFQKITFLTLLQIFYQNIKHRDGKAEKFETPHPQPALKIYQIDLGAVDLLMYQYIVENESEGINKQQEMLKGINPNSTLFSKNMKTFQQIHADSINIIYKNQGQNSDVDLKISQVSGFGELPIEKKNPASACHLSLNMKSIEGETFLKLIPENLQLSVNLDKLNHIIQFTNYDSDYTSNKIMPKKKKDSFMTVNVFPEKCCVKVGELQLYGDFYITYTKDFKNPVEKPALKFLFDNQLKDKSKYLDESFIKQQVSDKQIRVNGQNLQVYINKKHIGNLNRLFFGRTEFSAKETLKRFRKQSVMIDGLSAMANILELKQLYQTYQSYIKKAKDYKDKTLLLPSQQVPFKPKSTQKRIMQVQFQKSYVNLMRMLPGNRQKTIPPFMSYMTIQFQIPRILYSTLLKQQLISITDLSLKILQQGGSIGNNKIFQCLGLRLHYLENKQFHSKYMQIQNAKNIKINMKNMNQKLFALFGKEIMNLKELRKIELSRNNNRRILSQSLIQRQTSFNKIQYVNLAPEDSKNFDSESKIAKNQQQYFLIFENMTSKSIQVIVNNFQFSSQKNSPEKLLPIMLESKQIKIFEDTGIKMLQFLDQSSKQKNFITQLAFRQEGGPIIRKTMKQILYNGEIQLFSTSCLRYFALPNGFKIQIYQPFSVINTTSRPLFICLFDKKKNRLNKDWVVAHPGNEINFIGIQAYPHYFVLTDQMSKDSYQKGYQLIQISDLATNLSPNKIGPLHLFPSYLMEVVRWQSQQSSNRLKLVIFNRFRVQNNLPVSIQANFTTIQNFKQSVVESSSHASANKKQERKQIRLRINQNFETSYELTQILRYFSSFFTSSNSKAKKHESQIIQYAVPVVDSKMGSKVIEENYYRIFLYCKTGCALKNDLSQVQDAPNLNSNKTGHVSVQKNASKISSSIQKFINYNQIILVFNCSKLLKTACIEPRSGFTVGWLSVSSARKQPLILRKDNDYIMIPEKADGLIFNSLNSGENAKTFQFSGFKQKESVNIWGKYLLSSRVQKIGKPKETIYILQDCCTIQNKTNHIVDAYCITEQRQQNWSRKCAIFPRTKGSLPVSQKPSKTMNQSIQITAYCRNRQKFTNYHLSCSTKLELSTKNERSQNQMQKCSNQQVYYWSLNPQVAFPSKQFIKYESAVVKVTTKTWYFNQCFKYEIIVEPLTAKESNQNLMPADWGYKFMNNLPRNYSLIVKEEKGIMPQLRSITKQYEKYYQQHINEDEMVIPFDIDDQLPSPLISHKKVSNNYSQRMDEVNQLQKRESNRNTNRLQFSRQKNFNSTSRTVEYLIYPNSQKLIGLTNLQSSGKYSQTITLQIYRTDCNLQYEQKLQIKLNQLSKIQKQFKIKEDQFKTRNIHFEGGENHELESISSDRSGKKALQVFSKKRSNESAQNKYKQYRVQVHSHSKKQNAFQFFIQSQDLVQSSKKFIQQPKDYKRSLQLKIFEISITIQVTSSPADTLTLQLQNLKLNNNQLPPSSHLQQIDLKIDKLLIRQDKNLSILQMLHPDRQLLSVTASLQKVITGKRVDNLFVRVSPIQLNIRQGILFKVLSRVVELRNQYFVYGQKLDKMLISQNQNVFIESESIFTHKKQQKYSMKNKYNSKNYQLFLEQRQKQVKKQLKKAHPKIMMMSNLNIPKSCVYLSFIKDDFVDSKQQFIQDPIIKYFILIPAISQLRLDIPQIQINQFVGSSKQFSKLLLKKMKPNIGGTVIRSLGSLTILDSPVAAIDGVFQYLEAILMINRA